MIAQLGHVYQHAEVCGGLIALANLIAAMIDSESEEEMRERMPDLMVNSVNQIASIRAMCGAEDGIGKLTYQQMRLILAESCRHTLKILEGEK